MRALCLTLALGLALGLLSLVPAVSADPSTAAASSPAQLAKLPTDTPPAEAAPKAATPAPKVDDKQLAQLTYPVPTPSSSAASLLRAADDYFLYLDFASYRRCLEQVASAYPGSKEAGRALALLADDSIRAGDAAAASALSAEVAQDYPDPEVQAFASLVSTIGPASRFFADDYAAQEQTYLAYLQAWPNTSTSDWAALRLGDLYRFGFEDNDRAIAHYRSLLAQHRTGLVAEQALAALGETLLWSGTGRSEEAEACFQQVLSFAQTPYSRVRALRGLSEILFHSGELSAAEEILDQLLAANPTHPSSAHTYAVRSTIAEKRGDWEQTVADVKAYLSFPSSGIAQTTRAHWILAKDAFRHDRLDEAEAEFTLTGQLAAKTWHMAHFRGEAQAGLAYCAQARGDLRGAVQLFQQAADVEASPQKKAVYLFNAAELAKQLGDDPVRNAIIARMVAELPGSHLTTQLVGHELLPAPEL